MSKKKEKIKVVPGHPELTKKLKLYNVLLEIVAFVFLTCILWFMRMPATANWDVPFLLGMISVLVLFVLLFLYRGTYKKAEKIVREQGNNV